MKTAAIYQDVVYNENKPIINVLLETDFTKEIRIVMHQGTEMKEHKTNFPIVVQLLKGTIDFGVQGEIKQLNEGDLIALDANIPHNLKANKHSIIRLTLNKQDRVSRVQNVINS